MPARPYRILFADDEIKLAALKAQPQYAGWTFFNNPLSFSVLEADHNFALKAGDEDALSVQGPGVFTVGFAPAE